MQTVICENTHLNGRKHTFKSESFICFKCLTVSVCDWQVVADTNISAIASQVESLSSSTTPSTNPEVRPVEPEWVTSPWQQDSHFLFDIKHSVTEFSVYYILFYSLCVCIILKGPPSQRPSLWRRAQRGWASASWAALGVHTEIFPSTSKQSSAR